jgi:hypothetical protein
VLRDGAIAAELTSELTPHTITTAIYPTPTSAV